MNLTDSFTRNLEERFRKPLGKVAPSMQVQVYHRGKKVIDFQSGKKYKYYDWASLTKPVMTVSAMMNLYDKDSKVLDRSVSSILDWYPHKQLKVRDCLRHYSGLLWWSPFFKRYQNIPRRERWQYLQKDFKKLGPKPTKKTVYSDLDFILLGYILEELYGSKLEKIWQKQKKKFGMSQTFYHPNNKPRSARKNYAPTEYSSWRKKTLQGEVHDDNTWSWGGISSHAGLFGPMKDLAQWALLFRKAYQSRSGSRLASHKAVKTFSKRAVKRAQGDWALGLMMPAQKNSLVGQYFSPQSVGHWGFTGTSWWFDPKRDLIVLMLSNRVHPTRRNKLIAKARPVIHDVIWETIRKET